MKRNAVQWVWMLAISGVVLSAGWRFLNESTFFILLHVMVVNMAAFLLGFCIISPLKSLSVWKFLLYIAIISVLNWLIFSMWSYDGILLRFGQFIWFTRQVLPFIMGVSLNIGFLKYVSKIETRNAILAGTLIGMVHAQSIIVGLPIYF